MSHSEVASAAIAQHQEYECKNKEFQCLKESTQSRFEVLKKGGEKSVKVLKENTQAGKFKE